jgi:hypothetical protein
MLTTNASWVAMDGARQSIRQQLDATPFLPLIASAFPHVSSIVQNLLPG